MIKESHFIKHKTESFYIYRELDILVKRKQSTKSCIDADISQPNNQLSM